jgi:adenylate cyclase
MDRNHPAKQTETSPEKQTNSDQMNGYYLSKLLLKISRILAGCETLEQMLEKLMDIVTDELDAKRCTIFLSDPDTKELYSHVSGGGNVRSEIRIPEKSGVAGHVFSSGQSMIVHDAYNDKHFDKSIDEKTGFETKSILCTPIKTVRGEIIGVAQSLNKRNGQFTDEDLNLLDELLTHAAIVLQSTQDVERMKALHEQEREFTQVVAEIVAELDLKKILKKVMAQATKMINCDRTTLFLNDERTNELFSRVGEGIGFEIRLPNTAGIAGAVFTSGKTVNIPVAYADERFNPSTDIQTGYTTHSILCVPVANKNKKLIGVSQALNKKGGPFTEDDEFRLKAFTVQVSNAMENAQLFNNIQNMKNRSEGMLESMPTGVIALDDDGRIKTCNKAALDIFNVSYMDTLETEEDKNNEMAEAQERCEKAKAEWESAENDEQRLWKEWEKEWEEKDTAERKNRRKQAWKDMETIGMEKEEKKKFKTIEEARWKEDEPRESKIEKENDWKKTRKEEWKNKKLAYENSQKVLQGIKYKDPGKEPRWAKYFFVGENAWIMERIKLVMETQTKEEVPDTEIKVGGDKKTINLTVLPLVSVEKAEKLGTMIIIEDISENKLMLSTMARHMGSSVAEQLLAQGEENLKGKEERATVLFSDIRGFTTLTEELGPQGTVALLNEYFTIMVDCITKEQGWVNKFIGDAIMAGFGVPKRTENHEECGVRAAIAMLTSLNKWNEKRIEHGKKMVDIGIGINTDKVVTGNIGSFGTETSSARIEYTMIGDGVNLAARLETACKQYSARIIVSEYTYMRLEDEYISREIDSVVVKGKTKPVTIYEILDYHTEQSFPNMKEVIKYFKSGLGHYRAQRWDKATDTFKEALKANAEDKLSDMYIERCEHYKANPPSDDWDGVWVMKEK